MALYPFPPGEAQVLRNEGVSKGTFFFLIYVPFFCSSKRKEPKKKSPEKTTGSVFRHLRNAIFRSKKQSPVRTFSGLPTQLSNPQIVNKYLIINIFFNCLYVSLLIH